MAQNEPDPHYSLPIPVWTLSCLSGCYPCKPGTQVLGIRHLLLYHIQIPILEGRAWFMS